MTANAKVEQRHRDEAEDILFQWASRADSAASIAVVASLESVPIAQALANAEAAGYAAGVKDERERCAKWCECKVSRPAGYRGQWEGYGPFDDYMTGPECAAAIRARSDAKEVKP